MNKLRNILAIIFLILVILAFTYIDYSDLSWHANKGNYIGILSGLLGIISMILSNSAGKNQIN